MLLWHKLLILGVALAALAVVLRHRLAVVLRHRLAAMRRNVVGEPRPASAAVSSSVLDFTVTGIDGKPTDLGQFKGRVVLIVNVASKCGLTPQYAGLQKLYETYKDRGLVVIGFPANNFARQEPGGNPAIQSFCTLNYGVTFPIMAKISVKGAQKHPLYRMLTETPGPFAGEIGWNFTKFLVDRSGRVCGRFGPATGPASAELVALIERALLA